MLAKPQEILLFMMLFRHFNCTIGDGLFPSVKGNLF